MELRNNVLIDKEYYQEMQSLSPEEQGKVYKAIIDFGIARIEPQLDGALLAVYRGIINRIIKAQEKYDRCIKNGKLGGRKKAIEEPSENQDHNQEQNQNINQESNQDINQEANQEPNPNVTQPEPKPNPDQRNIETETEKENVSFPSVNKNNIFYLPTTEGVRPKEYSDNQRKRYLSPSYEYHEQDKYGEMFLLIADTLLEIQEYATEQGQIKFNGNVYTAEQVSKKLEKNGKKLVDGLAHKLINDTTIKNKPLYILGSLLSGN